MTKEVLLTNTCNDGRWRGIAGRARNDGRGDRIGGYARNDRKSNEAYSRQNSFGFIRLTQVKTCAKINERNIAYVYSN